MSDQGLATTKKIKNIHDCIRHSLDRARALGCIVYGDALRPRAAAILSELAALDLDRQISGLSKRQKSKLIRGSESRQILYR